MNLYLCDERVQDRIKDTSEEWLSLFDEANECPLCYDYTGKWWDDSDEEGTSHRFSETMNSPEKSRVLLCLLVCIFIKSCLISSRSLLDEPFSFHLTSEREESNLEASFFSFWATRSLPGDILFLFMQLGADIQDDCRRRQAWIVIFVFSDFHVNCFKLNMTCLYVYTSNLRTNYCFRRLIGVRSRASHLILAIISIDIKLWLYDGKVTDPVTIKIDYWSSCSFEYDQVFCRLMDPDSWLSRFMIVKSILQMQSSIGSLSFLKTQHIFRGTIALTMNHIWQIHPAETVSTIESQNASYAFTSWNIKVKISAQMVTTSTILLQI